MPEESPEGRFTFKKCKFKNMYSLNIDTVTYITNSNQLQQKANTHINESVIKASDIM